MSFGEQQENTGDCAQALPAEHPYTIDEEPAGRLYCRESLGGIELPPGRTSGR